MRNVEILRQVFHAGQIVKPLPAGGPVLTVEDHTVEHWLATGAAKAVSEAETSEVSEAETPKPKKGKAF